MRNYIGMIERGDSESTGKACEGFSLDSVGCKDMCIVLVCLLVYDQSRLVQ